MLEMSSSLDRLSSLAEKLKETINEIQDRYESFIDTNQLYKQGKIKDNDFFASIGDYLVMSSALSFITVQTIFELKSVISRTAATGDRPGATTKSASGGLSSDIHASTSGYGVERKTREANQYTMPKPQQSTFPPLKNPSPLGPRDSGQDRSTGTKNCIVCGKIIPLQAKFCTRCGKPQ